MSPIRMSKVEAALRVVLEFKEAFNRHDIAGMLRLMSADCLFEVSEPAPDGTPYRGQEAVTQFWQEFFRKSPQARLEVEEIFGLSDHCVMRWKYSWVDLEGRTGHVRGVDLYRVRDGLIFEQRSYVKG